MIPSVQNCVNVKWARSSRAKCSLVLSGMLATREWHFTATRHLSIRPIEANVCVIPDRLFAQNQPKVSNIQKLEILNLC